MAMCMDRNNSSISKPAETHAGAYQGFGTLHVQTGSKWLSQWCPEYFSKVLPFVIPRMVSGADFREETVPWRRQKVEHAPRVLVQVFVRGFARRVLSHSLLGAEDTPGKRGPARGTACVRREAAASVEGSVAPISASGRACR